MRLSMVVARSLNNVIGNGSEIPWRVKGEQKLFRDITMGGVLIMGRKTFESIGRPLPGRETIIVTRNTGTNHAGCKVAHSLAQAIAMAQASNRPVYIVGGGDIYQQALPLVDEVHLSTIQTNVDGDVFFPDFPTNEFHLVREEKFNSNINYTYQHYLRTKEAN
ncbi:MAG: dihydrofolate reductase [Pseudomonadales bacterium]